MKNVIVTLVLVVFCIAAHQITAFEKPDKTFLYFGASWCEPCRQMKAGTLKDPAVLEALKAFDTRLVDIDQNRPLANKYQVRAIPCYFLVDKDGRVLKRATGYRGRDDFLRWLK